MHCNYILLWLSERLRTFIDVCLDVHCYANVTSFFSLLYLVPAFSLICEFQSTCSLIRMHPPFQGASFMYWTCQCGRLYSQCSLAQVPSGMLLHSHGQCWWRNWGYKVLQGHSFGVHCQLVVVSACGVQCFSNLDTPWCCLGEYTRVPVTVFEGAYHCQWWLGVGLDQACKCTLWTFTSLDCASLSGKPNWKL